MDSIYCHWDGYLSHNGRILEESYTDEAKIRELIALGDLSSLGEEIGVKHPFDTPYDYGSQAYLEFKQKYGHMCNAYGRDRGEDAPFKSFDGEAEFVDYYDGSGAEFYYLFDHGVWYVKSYKSDFKPLHEELARLAKETENA